MPLQEMPTPGRAAWRPESVILSAAAAAPGAAGPRV